MPSRAPWRRRRRTRDRGRRGRRRGSSARPDESLRAPGVDLVGHARREGRGSERSRGVGGGGLHGGERERDSPRPRAHGGSAFGAWGGRAPSGLTTDTVGVRPRGDDASGALRARGCVVLVARLRLVRQLRRKALLLRPRARRRANAPARHLRRSAAAGHGGRKGISTMARDAGGRHAPGGRGGAAEGSGRRARARGGRAGGA